MPAFDPLGEDQALRLRELAGQLNKSQDASSAGHFQTPNPIPATRQHAPRAIIIGEAPQLNWGLSLAWPLAVQFCQPHQRVLIVDLTPSASRLPEILHHQWQFTRHQNKVRHGRECAPPRGRHPSPTVPTIQPLWQLTTHGRSPTLIAPSHDSPIDVLAQPSGDYPTADQMQRLCEQLLRRLSPRRETTGPGYSTVFFLSNALGIPLDQPCWSAADDVLLIHPENSCSPAQLTAALEARLAATAIEQRTWMLHLRERRILDLRTLNFRESKQPAISLKPDRRGDFRHMATFEATLPRSTAIPHHSKALQGLAQRLADVLGPNNRSEPMRQAC